MTPAQKAGKAERMIGYLEGVSERVEAVLSLAQGEERERLMRALGPVRGAVERALGFYRDRTK